MSRSLGLVQEAHSSRMEDDAHKASAGCSKAHIVQAGHGERLSKELTHKLPPASADVTPNCPQPGGGLQREWYQKREALSSHMNISNRPPPKSLGPGLEQNLAFLPPPAEVFVLQRRGQAFPRMQLSPLVPC